MYHDGIPVIQHLHPKGPLCCRCTYGASKENEVSDECRRRTLHSIDYEEKVK